MRYAAAPRTAWCHTRLASQGRAAAPKLYVSPRVWHLPSILRHASKLHKRTTQAPHPLHRQPTAIPGGSPTCSCTLAARTSSASPSSPPGNFGRSKSPSRRNCVPDVDSASRAFTIRRARGAARTQWMPLSAAINNRLACGALRAVQAACYDQPPRQR